ncbi:MAG: hypothetical protein CMP11_07535 [Zetaproteobacteria bacterium]|nr:hypothetical protein [Pseudobdellovibrionaceae bacterium]
MDQQDLVKSNQFSQNPHFFNYLEKQIFIIYSIAFTFLRFLFYCHSLISYEVNDRGIETV